MRIFWPVYLVIALVCTALVWFAAPSVRDSIPEGLRSKWAHGVATLRGVDLEGMEQEDYERREADREARIAAEVAAARTQSPEAAPSRRTAVSRQVSGSHRIARDPAAPDDDPGEVVESPSGDALDEPLPSMRGIMHTDYKDAEWGIVNAVTPYRSLADGEVAGNAGVGAVFVVSQRQPAEGGGVEFVGRFQNHSLDEPVTIPAGKLYCFTGSYDSLSPRQKSCLSAYYKARAESERIKREIMRESGGKSPYFRQAVDAKAKWDAMVKETEALEVALRTDKNANASRIHEKLARMKGEMAVQQAKVKELSDKHKEWKEKNSSSIADPDEDPRLKKLCAEMSGYAKAIPGLAF